MRKKSSILIPGLIYAFFIVALSVLILFFREEGVYAIIILTGLLIMGVLAGIIYFVFRIYFPLKELRQRMEALSKSELLPSSTSNASHEIAGINNALDQHLERIQEIAKVANHLADGTGEEDFKDHGMHDVLGKAMLKVKNSILASNKEAVQRRSLDEQQNWASRGLAKFGEMLRDFEQQVEERSDLFIMELVKYLGFEVGGLFLARKDENGATFYEMTGAYAFDRKKQVKKTFKPGEGLVGRCAIEKQSIIMTKIPEDYIRIRSGMGEDEPATLLLVPVILDDQVLGIMELATFSIVKNYKIRFLETLGKSISSSFLKAV